MCVITAMLCCIAKLCTVSPVDESMHTWLATCNDLICLSYVVHACGVINSPSLSALVPSSSGDSFNALVSPIA